MRSLWPAIGVCAVAAACGRPNPGFQLLDSSADVDSDGQSASLGSTDPGSASMAMTATGTPTSTEPTGVATATASSDATSTTVEDTMDLTSGTTMAAGEWKFPIDCAEPQEVSEWFPAEADTFFVNETEAGKCSFTEAAPDCRNMEFSKSKKFQLFLNDGQTETISDDYVGIFAVRFAQPKPLYMGKVEVPEEAFIAIDVRVHLSRPPDPIKWAGIKLDVRRFVPGDVWSTDMGADFTPCFDPAASYRCRACNPGPFADGQCVEVWNSEKGPYDSNALAIESRTLGLMDEPDPNVGAELILGPYTSADLAWLISEGFMLMPAANTELGTIEVRTLDEDNAGWHPGLRVRYCTPEFVPY